MKCISCQTKDAVRGEFCTECFSELIRDVQEESFEIPSWKDVKEVY